MEKKRYETPWSTFLFTEHLMWCVFYSYLQDKQHTLKWFVLPARVDTIVTSKSGFI